MNNIDSISHVTGKSVYLDDIPLMQGTLFAVPFGSDISHGKILDIDVSPAKKIHGVHAIIMASDICGENQIGGILPDEPLLAENEVHYIGQPIALIIAENELIGRRARKLIRVKYHEKPAVTDPREAKENGDLLFPPRTFESGNIDEAWKNCEYIFSGRADTAGQEHLYIETQGAYSYPLENGKIKIHSSTQGPTIVQKTIATVLGLSMHHIEVDVCRLGGAFGGKEDQATVWACLAALATHLLNCPVKLSLHRLDDMKMTGKRHPYSSDFKIGLSKEFRILAFETTYYQNGGAAADLSPAIMERTLFHATNTYFIPNVRATAYSCKTNLTPFTAFRGFGAPQAMFVIESAIAKAGVYLQVPAWKIQQENLIKENQHFHYGQLVKDARAIDTWSELFNEYKIEKAFNVIEIFNTQNKLVKKGMAIMPVCFGISFTKTPMNQARALVHIYQDGSIGISTGAVEMGQAVNTKLVQVAALAFSVSPAKIKIESTNTTRVANTSPTAASSGADLNGKALQIACHKLLVRLRTVAATVLETQIDSIEIEEENVIVSGKKTKMGWEELVEETFNRRINLSAIGHYSTPVVHFDKSTEKGHPFAYHVYGTAAITVELDCLRGRYEIENVDVVHDFGTSLNRKVDLGQIEGGLVQGIGWMTIEELAFSEKGKLLSNSLSTYKVSDIYSAPKSIHCKALEQAGPELAILRSKAVGEPPLMYGIAAYFAIQNAVMAFNPDNQIEFNAPFTPEKVLMALYNKKSI